MYTPFEKLIDHVFTILYPNRCIICTELLDIQSRLHICSECNSGLEIIQGPVCIKCGAPLAAEGTVCISCLHIEKSFDRNYSFMIYDDLAKSAIYRLKFGKHKSVAKDLIEILYDRMDLTFFHQHNLMIPIPLHKTKYRERGFNQSELLSHHLYKHTGVPVATDALIKVKATKRQSALGKEARKNNLKGAFSVSNKKIIYQKSVLLIDDIFTTGATISECAHALLQAGAKNVSSFTIARTVFHNGY